MPSLQIPSLHTFPLHSHGHVNRPSPPPANTKCISGACYRQSVQEFRRLLHGVECLALLSYIPPRRPPAPIPSRVTGLSFQAIYFKRYPILSHRIPYLFPVPLSRSPPPRLSSFLLNSCQSLRRPLLSSRKLSHFYYWSSCY